MHKAPGVSMLSHGHPFHDDWIKTGTTQKWQKGNLHIRPIDNYSFIQFPYQHADSLPAWCVLASTRSGSTSKPAPSAMLGSSDSKGVATWSATKKIRIFLVENSLSKRCREVSKIPKKSSQCSGKIKFVDPFGVAIHPCCCVFDLFGGKSIYSVDMELYGTTVLKGLPCVCIWMQPTSPTKP